MNGEKSAFLKSKGLPQGGGESVTDTNREGGGSGRGRNKRYKRKARKKKGFQIRQV